MRDVYLVGGQLRRVRACGCIEGTWECSLHLGLGLGACFLAAAVLFLAMAWVVG